MIESTDGIRPPVSEGSPATGAGASPTATIGRRGLLQLAILGAGSSGLTLRPGRTSLATLVDPEPSDRALIVRSTRPLNLESPIEALDHRLTPNDLFFVRSHFGAPAVDLHPWQVEIVGLVDHPLRLSLADLARLPEASYTAVLQCAGNGRGLYRPRVPGTPWERGGVGQAEWSGVHLADLLSRAGVQPGAAHVHFAGGDAPPSPRTPAFVRSIPLDRAQAANTILATRMNGQPLPVVHGGPLRLVVPGWFGNNWTKWVRRIVVAREESPSFFMQTAYRIPPPPGETAKSAPRSAMPQPVTWMNVKSLITWPRPGQVLAARPAEVRGIAWTGQGHVVKVEVSLDGGGRWVEATLLDDPEPGSWRRWRLSWDAADRGRHRVAARATDSTGQVQPETPAWNKSGYLWNGIESVDCEIR